MAFGHGGGFTPIFMYETLGGTGEGGGGEVLRWLKIDQDETDAITSGVYYVQLTFAPTDPDGLFVFFDRTPLLPPDWTYVQLTNRIYFHFDFDPAVEAVAGSVHIYIQYQYTV